MLYLVATPIGNLGDISLRALDVLREVDIIAAEDTRKTSILLNKYEISKPKMAYHEHNEPKAVAKILELLAEGKSVAVVSEAGTPAISDPGYSVVRQAVDAGFDVTMIPGATAVTMAVVLSGLPAHAALLFVALRRAKVANGKTLCASMRNHHTRSFFMKAHIGCWRFCRMRWRCMAIEKRPFAMN